MFESILGKNIVDWQSEEIERPDFFTDLNLQQLIKVISEEVSEYDILPYFYHIDLDEGDVIYRHQVLMDLEEEAVFTAVREFSTAMKKVSTYLEYAKEMKVELQKECWRMNAGKEYTSSLLAFLEQLNHSEIRSEGLKGLRDLLEEESKREEFTRLHDMCFKADEEMQKIRVTLDIGKDKILLLPTVSELKYADHLEKFFEDKVEDISIATLLAGELELTELEQELLKRLEKRFGKNFEALHRCKEISGDFVPDFLKAFCNEVQFYIAFIRFRKDMERFGFTFSYPRFVDQGMEIRGLYDLALAHKNAYEQRDVVRNDAMYQGKELFFVLTGPNQGGKTTYARALGQIVYFSKIGLMLPCETCELPFFEGIMSHFEVEESMMSGEGKLKEELGRLKPMLMQSHRKQFVIINELFTTAATYDATIMGKKVLEHFVKDGCYGIYVTHIQKLAEETDEIVSLVATMDEELGKRTYQIQREKARGKGYITALVDKYHLSYEDINKRLGGEMA